MGKPDCMKVLQVNTERGWRGGERQTLLTAMALRDLGCEVEILCRKGEPLAEHASNAGLVVHTVQTRQGAWWWLCLNGRAYDVIHAQTANALTWVVLSTWLHRKPIVFTRRTSFDEKASWSTGWKWKRTDMMAAISEDAARAPRALGLDPAIIRSAVPALKHDDQRVRDYLVHHHLEGKVLVGTAAALSPEKGALTLIHAAHTVCEHRPEVVFLHWGAGGHQSELVRQEIDSLGMQDQYRLMGFETDVEMLYPMLSVFVMASRQEALGSSVLDAMQVGVPVVSTDAGGLKETLADGRGLLSSVDDDKGMAANILAALSEPDHMQAMVARAHEYVQREHSVADMAKRYLMLYRAGAGRSGS